MPRAMRRTRLSHLFDDARLALAALVACLLVALTAPGGRAQDVDASSKAVSRSVLAVYDSKAEGPPHQTRLHKLAEMPLNHLGYWLDYVDVNGPLPSGDALQHYRGVIISPSMT
jgi:hypothetical protein